MELVGRDCELGCLRDLLFDDPSGGNQVAIVSGVVAMGKTALLHAFEAEAARRGALVLSASASRAERGLPMGVLGQLLSCVPLDDRANRDVASLLDAGMLSATLDDSTEPAVPVFVLNGVLRIVRELAARAPVLIAVDDAEHTDPGSLHCLGYLARRLRSAQALLVLGESTECWPAKPPLTGQLLRHARCTHIELRPLATSAVTAMLAARLGARTAKRLGADVHRLSGGNPMLAGALIDDIAGRAGQREPVIGDAFKKAVTSCLTRCGSDTVAHARAVAMLDCPATADDFLARLLEVDMATVAKSRNLLHTMGLTDEGRFRHENARLAVLDGIEPDVHTRLHMRAARLRYEDEECARIVARHLVASGPDAITESTWALPVLEEAAELARQDNNTTVAISCLRLAYRVCTDDRQRARILAVLAGAEWQVNPEAVTRLFPDLIESLRSGRLHGRRAIESIGYLLWHGKPDEARNTLRRFTELAGSLDPESVDSLEAMRVWLSLAYPGLRSAVEHPGRDADAHPYAHATRVLRRVLDRDQDITTVDGAEQVLEGTSRRDTELVATMAGLAAFIYAGRLNRAAYWCDVLLDDDPSAKRSSTARALFAAARALIAIRQGDLVLAKTQAGNALTLLAPRSWGVAVGFPLAAMIIACTATGALDEAATYLDSQVPDAMFQTPAGLHYLHARGSYYQATGHHRAALVDFQTCGSLMLKWDLDLPTLVPWRIATAWSQLGLRDTKLAGNLLEQQLATVDSGDCRTRGMALRALATTREPDERRVMLRDAVHQLKMSGDRLELALATADLSHVQFTTGHVRDATLLAKQAFRLARQASAEPLQQTLLARMQEMTGPAAEPVVVAEPDALAELPAVSLDRLTTAERRVALLAAEGHSNRKIAMKLYVTVSTVEQHLTRIYRKLEVTGRAELNLMLRPVKAETNVPASQWESRTSTGSPARIHGFSSNRRAEEGHNATASRTRLA